MENHHLYGESSCLWDVYDHLYHIYISSFSFWAMASIGFQFASSFFPWGHPQLPSSDWGKPTAMRVLGAFKKKGDRIVRLIDHH